MVNRQDWRKKRGGSRVLIFCITALFLLGSCFFLFSSKPPRGRLGLVLPGNPTIVVSWESERQRFAVFILPETMQINAIKGYGWYGLDALWKLDSMDARKGILFRSSLEDALATPIQWHSANTFSNWTGSSDEIVFQLKGIFSFSNCLHMVLTGKTNIPLGDVPYVWKKFQIMGFDKTTVFDFRQGQIAGAFELPDQTSVWRFDSEKYDAIVGNNLEDTPLRQEGMRIALYNTTGTPGIAQRIAREIELSGGFVVSVGNDDNPYEGLCEVSGMKPQIASLTANFFRSQFGCSLVERQTRERADLVVRLGKGIERRFLPEK